MKTLSNSSLLTNNEVEAIFSDMWLLERKSFFIIDEIMGGYDTHRADCLLYMQDILQVKEAFLSGKSIVVKNLANYNQEIRKKCAEYGREVDVCMFVSPPNGSTFGWHFDYEDVYIHEIVGKKIFKLEGHENILLEAGECLNIKPLLKHAAETTNEVSIHLSFGIKQICYGSMFGGLTKKDFGLI